MPSLANVLLLQLLALYIFSILGVQLLCGRVSFCSEAKFLTKKTCLQGKATWETHPQNYNNIFSSMLTFFEIETLGDWSVFAF